MSRSIKNSYVKVPSGTMPAELIEEVRALLLKNDRFDRIARIQYQFGAEWICIYDGGFLSLEEQGRIESLRLLTQNCVDEVVMVAGYSGVSSGAYGHFVEGALVRFLAQCEDWSESIGVPEPWERDLIQQPAGITDLTVYDIGDRLRLPSCCALETRWDIDIPIA